MATAPLIASSGTQDFWSSYAAAASDTKSVVAMPYGNRKFVIRDAGTSKINAYGTDYQWQPAWGLQSDARLLAVESLIHQVSEDVLELKEQVQSLVAFRERASALESAIVHMETSQESYTPELLLPPQAAAAQSLAEMVVVLGQSPVGDTWSATLDYIADKEPNRFPFGGELAELALGSDDAAVRAAAARALAVSNPAKARILLPPRYEQEKNRAVRAALSSAMRLSMRA